MTSFRASRQTLAVLVAGVMVSGWGPSWSIAQAPGPDVAGAEVLTRGPVHEAFAGMVSFNLEPGVVVPKAPPAAIEEVPPTERPEGDNVTWIPGYWAWDDERTDFVWVSGTWRALPPGRQWMAGYWGQTPEGHQWTSGYWADATARETTYLPAPPATVEAGPNIAAPSADYGWAPGCWMWYQGRYAWGPGYWVRGRADWDWTPAHYVWTPRGFIYVGGFWDYPVERRGILFAPVYFDAGWYSRRSYAYAPSIVIDLGVFSDHLFLRPRYGHYYFGDYYAASYSAGGIYASFTFQSRRFGYDPIYSHQRWEHRQDRDWERRAETTYQYRRDNEAARPPRTWAAQRNLGPNTAEAQRNRTQVGTSMEQLAKRKDSPMRFQPVAKAEQQRLLQRAPEIQKSRDERRTVESQIAVRPAQNAGTAFAPAKVPTARSPIVGRPVNQSGRNQPPSKSPVPSKPIPQVRPTTPSPVRPPNSERVNPQPAARQPSLESTPAPDRSESSPKERSGPPAAQPRANPPEVNSRSPWQPQPRESVRPADVSPAVPAERRNDPIVRAPASRQPNPNAGAPEPGRNKQPSVRQRPAVEERGATKLIRNQREQLDRGNSPGNENQRGR